MIKKLSKVICHTDDINTVNTQLTTNFRKKNIFPPPLCTHTDNNILFPLTPLDANLSHSAFLISPV